MASNGKSGRKQQTECQSTNKYEDGSNVSEESVSTAVQQPRGLILPATFGDGGRARAVSRRVGMPHL